MKWALNFSSLIVAVAAVFFLARPCPAGESSVPAPHPMDGDLGGPKSPYTERLIGLLKTWPAAAQFCHASTEPLAIQTVGIRTADHPYYVGFKKCMIIEAPLPRVEAVIDDVAHYEELFPGFKQVSLVWRSANELVLLWERPIPVFFVPNIKYEIAYLSDKSESNRVAYRYQFKSGDRLKFNDGIEVLEREGKSTTRFTNYEFYEADYGIGLFGLSAVSSEKVWEESLKGSYLSLLSIRLKAEHPDWSYSRIARARDEELEKVASNKVSYLDDWSDAEPKTSLEQSAVSRVENHPSILK